MGVLVAYGDVVVVNPQDASPPSGAVGRPTVGIPPRTQAGTHG